MYYLRYLCLFAYIVVLLLGFFFVIFIRPVYCVLNVASFSGSSIFLLPLWCSITFNYNNSDSKENDLPLQATLLIHTVVLFR